MNRSSGYCVARPLSAAVFIFVMQNTLAAQTVDVVLSALVAGRQQLHSADVTVTGRQYRLDKEGKLLSEQAIHEHLIWDFVGNNVRSEHERFALALVPPPNSRKPLGAGDQESKAAAGYREDIVAGKGVWYKRSVAGKKIEIFDRKSKLEMWDLRTFGLATYDDLVGFNSLEDFEATFKRAKSANLLSVENGDASNEVVLTMKWKAPDSKADFTGRRRVWCDAARRYVPIRVEDQYLKTEKDGSDWHKAHESSVAHWTTVANVDLPTSVTAEFRNEDKRSRISAAGYDLAFEWHSVNEPIKEEVFALESLDSPKGSHLIVDTRTQCQPIVIQHPAIPDALTLRSIDKGAKPSSNNPTPAGRTLFSFYPLLLINAVVLLSLACIWWFKRKRR